MASGTDILRLTGNLLVEGEVTLQHSNRGLTLRPSMAEPCYRTHRIKKKSGGYRTIHVPAPWLKKEQKHILRELKNAGIAASKYAHGFVTGRSVRTAAQPHVGKRIVLKMDLQDFFGKCTKAHVLHELDQAGASSNLVHKVDASCFVLDHLPQGAPTSPFLSNLAFSSVDLVVNAYVTAACDPAKVDYTRFADDLTFSSDSHRLSRLVPGISRLLSKNTFPVNLHKTRVMRKTKMQICVGVIVNEKTNLPRRRRRKIRAEIHAVRRMLEEGTEVEDKVIARLHGLVGYAMALSEHYGSKYKQEVEEIVRLSGDSEVIRLSRKQDGAEDHNVSRLKRTLNVGKGGLRRPSRVST